MAAILYFVFATLLSTLSVASAVEECPPWFTLNNDKSSNFPQCVCSGARENAITCDQKGQMTFLSLGFCALFNTTINDTVVANCPYVFPKHLVADGYICLPQNLSELNQFICGNLNRDIGNPLCGKCINGTGPSIHSVGSQCVRCSAVNIVYYLLLCYLPTTILFMIIMVFRISITSAPMAHYVLFCNSIVLILKSLAGHYANLLHTAAYKHAFIWGKFLLTLNAIWTLDVLYFVSPPLCVSVHIEEIYLPFLSTVATLYPFILLLLTYVGIELHARDCKPVVGLWRVFHRMYVRFRRTWDPNASVIQAFATLFFLSYMKFVSLMYEGLLISHVISMENKVVATVTYVDPTVSIFSSQHWLLLSLSVFILIFIILPPSLLLIIFPTRLFKKISRCLKPRWIISIQTFVDTFHGCCKDGSNGSRDYRAVSGYILIIWIFLPAVEITTRTLTYRSQFLSSIGFIMFFTALTVVCALLRPYKHRNANISGIVLPAIWAMAICLWITPNNPHHTLIAGVVSCLLLSLPHCVFYGYILYRMGKFLKQVCCLQQDVENNVNQALICRP